MFQARLFWEIYGPFALFFAAVGVMLELLWWTFLFADRSEITLRFTLITYGFAIAGAVMLPIYVKSKARRAATMRWEALERDVLDDGRGFDVVVARFPVRVQYVFFIVSAIFAFSRGFIRGGALVVSVTIAVLAHELGHAFVARRNRQAAAITLHALGGYTTYFGVALTRAQHFAVAFAGPAVGLVIGAAAWTLAQFVELPPLADGILRDFIYVNAGWAVFNLLPILPMDGGRLVQTMTRSELTPIRVSVAAGGLAGVAAAATGSFATVVVCAMLTLQNALQLPSVRRLDAAVESWRAGRKRRALRPLSFPDHG